MRTTSLLLAMTASRLVLSPCPAHQTLDGTAPDRLESILFVVREPHDDWYHPTGERGDINPVTSARNPRPLRGLAGQTGPAAVCRLDRRTGHREILFHTPRGDIRGCDLHPDGRRLVLSLREGGPEQPYRLVELTFDTPPGRRPSVRPITDGPFDDVDPVYLPDGTILFASSRPQRWMRAIDAPALNLCSCAADGSNLCPRSSHDGLQRTPTTLPDGRVIWAQWDDAIDQAQPTWTSHLRTGNPDGTERETVLSLASFHRLSFLQPRALPGSSKFVAVAVPSQALTRDKGWIVWIDASFGSDDPAAVHLVGAEPGRISRVLEPTGLASLESPPLHVEHPEFRWRYPYPLTDDLVLATTDREICLVNREGRYQVLFTEREIEGELACVQPMAPWIAARGFWIVTRTPPTSQP